MQDGTVVPFSSRRSRSWPPRACSPGSRQAASTPSDWLLYAIFAALLLGLVFVSGAAVAPSRSRSLGLGALVALRRVAGGLGRLVAVALARPRRRAPHALLRRRRRDRAVHRPRRASTGLIVTGAVAFGTGRAGGRDRARGSARTPATYFVGDGRLAWPITYPNAAAAMFLVGLWPALVLAAERRLPVVVRGARARSRGRDSRGLADDPEQGRRGRARGLRGRRVRGGRRTGCDCWCRP